MIKIYTDSAADFSRRQAQELDINIIQLKINFKDHTYYQEDDEEDFRYFYEMLKNSAVLPTTSQANPLEYMQACEEAKNTGNAAIIITISSKLSTSFLSALMAKEEVGYDQVYVVDSLAAIAAQRLLVEYAVKLRSHGFTATRIFEKLTDARSRVRLWGIVDTMEYLYKGGRMSRATAFIGSVLNIKPIIEFNDGALVLVDKARSTKSAIRTVFDFMEADGPLDNEAPVYFIYTGESSNRETCQKFRDASLERLNIGGDIYAVGGVVGTHTGPGCLAVTYLKKEPIIRNK